MAPTKSSSPVGPRTIHEPRGHCWPAGLTGLVCSGTDWRPIDRCLSVINQAKRTKPNQPPPSLTTNSYIISYNHKNRTKGGQKHTKPQKQTSNLV